MGLLSFVESSLDASLQVLEELGKTSVREVSRLGSQLTNGISGLVLYALNPHVRSKQYRQARRRIRRLSSATNLATSSTWGSLSSLLNLDGGVAMDGDADFVPPPPPPPPSAPARSTRSFIVSPRTDDLTHSSEPESHGPHSDGDASAPLPLGSERGGGLLRRVNGSLRRLRRVPTVHGQSLPAAQSNSNDNIYNVVVDHSHEKTISGLFEDVQLTVQLWIGNCVWSTRELIHSIASAIRRASPRQATSTIAHYYKRLYSGLRRPKSARDPPSAAAAGVAHRRLVHEIVRNAGYVHESHTVVTDDGYLLTMDRIPRPESTKVVLFQHGLLDTGFAWIANGTIGSLAFRAWDMGYDVYIGNFRGTGQQGHRNPKMTWKQYWDFSVDDHGTKDIAAFVASIRRIKAGELPSYPRPSPTPSPSFGSDDSADWRACDVSPTADSNERPRATETEEGCGPRAGSGCGNEPSLRIDITAVAHSMGGAAMMIYLVHSRLRNRPHHISHAIIMSPAGFQLKAPWWQRVFSYVGWYAILPLVTVVQPPFATTVHRLGAKLWQDIKSQPATMDLISYVCSYFVGGHIEEHPIKSLDILSYQNSATSAKLLRHGLQTMFAKRFQSYDYGPKRNWAEYGQSGPIDYGANYHLLDIPIDILSGAQDWLIPEENVKQHYTLLHAAHPHLTTYRSFPECGHLDWTVGLDDQVISHILHLLATPDHRLRRSNTSSAPLLAPS